MRLFRDLPIKRKLTWITMVTTTVALVLTCVTFAVYDQVVLRRDLMADLSTTARMVGFNSASALSFNDPNSAGQALQALGLQPHIQAARIFAADGSVFATFHRPGAKRDQIPMVAEADATRFGRRELALFRSIDFGGEKLGTIYLESDLDEIWARLMRYGLTLLLVMLGAGLVAYLVIARLQRIISDPISRLATVTGRVAKENDYTVRAHRDGNDELGKLIDAFNDMLEQIQRRDLALREAHEKLEERVAERTRELQTEIVEHKAAEVRLADTHRRLIDASRQAGMAEVATGVLHNVGNVLNSVNVSATLVADQVRRSKAGMIGKVGTLLREHETDLASFLTADPRGRQVPEYLHTLAGHVAEEQADAISELEALRKNIEHIKDIVAMQQSYARVSGLAETVGLVELVEDALRMNAGALARHEVTLVRDFRARPVMTIEKHNVLQILVNCIRNAKYACDEAGRPNKRITVSVSEENGWAEIAVIDNGIGIPAENLTRIFGHGFTTRKDGHGFGLHSGAIAAKELGGELTVQSDGVGHGATFTLRLPHHPNGNAS